MAASTARRLPLKRYDCVVVGAGIAGLIAARALVRAKASVLVLEGHDRVGGRMLTHRLEDGTSFDLGAQWIGPDMPKVHALIAEFGLTPFAQHQSGFLDRGAFGGSMTRVMRAEWEWLQAHIETLVAGVDVEHPAATPHAEELDQISVEEWKRHNLDNAELRAQFDQIVRGDYTIEPKDLSMLHFLFNLRSCGGVDNALAVEGGAQETRVIEGLGSLPVRVAEKLGRRVRLNSQVYEIEYDEHACRVTSESITVAAEHVILAVPPTQAQRIDFGPVLPRRRTRVMQRMEMGSVIKCFAIYDRPFWRTAAARAVPVDELVFDVTLDATSVDGRHPALVALIGGDDAVAWSDRPGGTRRRAVLEGLSRIFGDEALYPRDYFDHDWLTEPFINGGFNCYAPTGVMLSGFDELRLPIGRLHFAGTETAPIFYGYVEGAIDSGERAAAEVCRALGRPLPHGA